MISIKNITSIFLTKSTFKKWVIIGYYLGYYILSNNISIMKYDEHAKSHTVQHIQHLLINVTTELARNY